MLVAVGSGLHRPGELERRIAGMSKKVLYDRSRAFTRTEIFVRITVRGVSPRVEYHLSLVSDFGQKFLRLVWEVEKLQPELSADKASSANQ